MCINRFSPIATSANYLIVLYCKAFHLWTDSMFEQSIPNAPPINYKKRNTSPKWPERRHQWPKALTTSQLPNSPRSVSLDCTNLKLIWIDGHLFSSFIGLRYCNRSTTSDRRSCTLLSLIRFENDSKNNSQQWDTRRIVEEQTKQTDGQQQQHQAQQRNG